MHEQETIEIKRGRSIIMDFDENVQTIAQGRPGRYGVVVLTPRRILLNGQNPGAASLTIISESRKVT
ncbi:MAG: pilus assembly protein N-terminal domain-containing protein, partial [Thiotrichales bacterium]|nr:pilus assembly protein N-terminal domain-containing protein [Thiotrichales bacterium]